METRLKDLINGPAYLGAPIPADDPKKINVRKAGFALRPKTIWAEVQGDLVYVDWETQEWEWKDLDAAAAEANRAIQARGWTSRVDVCIHARDCDYAESWTFSRTFEN